MIVRTNIAGMAAHRNIKIVSNEQERSVTRMSSGKRINTAADDPAGLGISERMESQIRSLRQAEKNTEDASSLLQTMDGAMEGVQGMLGRVRELLIKGLNDTNAEEDKEVIQMEVDQMLAEIGEMADRSQFNTIPLLNVPEPGSPKVTTELGPVTAPATSGPWEGNNPLKQGDVFFVKIEPIPTNTDDVTLSLISPDNTPNNAVLEAVDGFPGMYQIKVAGSLLEKWAVSVKAESGGPYNVSSSHTVQRGVNDPDLPSRDLHIQASPQADSGVKIWRHDIRPAALNIGLVRVQPHDIGMQSLENVDAAFNIVTAARSSAGAQQNRLEQTGINLATAYLNLEQANSRIRDADMAKEMMNLAKSNFLQQASQSMLMMSNQAPQRVMQLLEA